MVKGEAEFFKGQSHFAVAAQKHAAIICETRLLRQAQCAGINGGFGNQCGTLVSKARRQVKALIAQIIGLADEKARCQPVFIVQLMVEADIDAAGLIFRGQGLEKLALGQIACGFFNIGYVVIIISRIGQDKLQLRR